MSDKDPLVKVDIGSPLSIKAEIKTEIPSGSSGRLLDALTDAIRPFTEGRGLKADIIRLQREDVLLEIAKKASERFALENRTPGQVPNKFLIPFLEKASTEGDEAELIQMWANLLVSASTEYNSSHVRFTSILAEMGAREVKMLERYCSSSRSNKPIVFLADAPIDGRSNFLADALVFSLDALVAKYGEEVKEAEVNEVIEGKILEDEAAGFIVDNVYVRFRGEEVESDRDEYLLGEVEYSHPAFPPNVSGDEVALSILENLGLLRTELFSLERPGYGGYIKIVHLTRFGLEFYLACNPDIAKTVRQSL